MKDDISLLEKIFDKYKVSQPLTGDVQNHSLRMRRRLLVKILKKLKIYSPIYGAIIFIFFLFKKIGIGLTVIQSAVFLLIMSVITAITLSVGSYAAVKYFILDRDKSIKSADLSVSVQLNKQAIDNKTDIRDDSESDLHIANRKIIFFPGLINNGANDALVKQISIAIKNEIIKLKGKGVIEFRPLNRSANIILSGSVEKLDDLYMISIRITNRKNRRIIFTSSEEFKSEKGFEPACKKLAKDIIHRM